jgi:hypothetical protein
MISADRIRELIRLGNENRNLDYKGAFSWDQINSDEKCEITKDILAFSNTRDGGAILLGVNDKTGVLEGLTEEQYASFDQTKFNSFVHRYTDPRHTSNVHRILIDEKRVVVIDVPEFADVPILCARDANSSVNQSKLILRRAALYMRTDKATSEVIEDADAMRELLNRGLLRRQDDLLRAIKQIVLPSQTTAISEPGAEFKAELEHSDHYISELDGGSFSQLPRWAVQLQPDTYIANRLQAAAQLQRLVQESAISLRGWTFPIVGRVTGAAWTNFDGGSQSFFNGRGQRPEALQAYKSGLVIWSSGIGEDTWHGLAGQNAVSFIALIYSVTEWVLFAKRFYEKILSVDERVHLTVRGSGLKGRRLISTDPSAELHGDFHTEVPWFETRETVGVSDLRADSEAIARRIIRRVFELFNWNDPDEKMLQNWQQKLLQRQF